MQDFYNFVNRLDHVRVFPPYSFSAPTRVIRHHGCPASLGLQVHCGVVVLHRRVEENVGSRVDAGELLAGVRAGKTNDADRHLLNLLLGEPHKDDYVLLGIQLSRQAHEVNQALALGPNARHAQNHESIAYAVPLAEVTRGGLEHVRINGVVTHLHGVPGQETLPHQVREPLRRRDELHAPGRYQVEEPLLLVEIPRAGCLGVCLRVGAELRAPLFEVRTVGLPLCALHICEVRTVARESPAVVQGPLDFAVVNGEPLEQHLDVDVVAVQVVQVHDVGPDLVEPGEQPCCRRLGVEAGTAVKAGLERVQMDFRVGGKTTLTGVLRGTASAPEGERVVAGS